MWPQTIPQDHLLAIFRGWWTMRYFIRTDSFEYLLKWLLPWYTKIYSTFIDLFHGTRDLQHQQSPRWKLFHSSGLFSSIFMDGFNKTVNVRPFFTRTTFMEVMSDARDRPKRDTGYSVLMWQHIPKIQLSNKVIRQRYLLTLVFSGINRSLLEVVFFTCLWTTQLIIQIEIVIFTTTTEPTTEAFEYLASKPGTMLSRQRYSVVTWQTRWLKRYNKKTHKLVNPNIHV